MPLTVLSDLDVRRVLDSLNRDDILKFHMALADALHTYSTGEDDNGCCAANQPSRVVTKGKDGRVTLFMPTLSNDAIAVKVVSVAEKASDSSSNSSSQNSIALTDRSSSNAASSTTASSSETSSTYSSSIRKGSTTSTSESTGTATDREGNAVPGLLVPGTQLDTTPQLSDTSPQGSITLLSPTGTPRAIINASTLTAFRTALASVMCFKKRRTVHTVTVFGAGMQAYWHIHLSLLLRGAEIHHLNIINRSFPRAQRLLMTLAQSSNSYLMETLLGQKLKPTILTPEYGEYSRLLKEYVRDADVIYTCTPSTKPLFPAGHLTHTEGRRKARYICAVGSYKPHMQELHEDILHQAVAGPYANKGGLLHHKHAAEGGAVVVDTIEGAMKEAGDIIKARIGGNGVVELGEIVMLKRSHWAEKAERERREREAKIASGELEAAPDSDQANDQKKHHHIPFSGHGLGHLFHKHEEKERQKKEAKYNAPEAGSGDGGLQEWLERGNVIYKSVGIGLMDLVVACEVVKLAEERGIGTTIPEF